MEFTFILANFGVGFVSDIVLNILSRGKWLDFEIINSLRPYFARRTLSKAAIDAGLTVVIVLLGVMLVSKAALGHWVPTTYAELWPYLILAYILGHIADIAIEKLKIFGSDLDAYYTIAGAGFWGGMALVFSVVVSFALQKCCTYILQ